MLICFYKPTLRLQILQEVKSNGNKYTHHSISSVKTENCYIDNLCLRVPSSDRRLHPYGSRQPFLSAYLQHTTPDHSYCLKPLQILFRTHADDGKPLFPPKETVIHSNGASLHGRNCRVPY